MVTHPRVYQLPMPLALAVRDLGRLLASPTLLLLAETPNHLRVLLEVLTATGATGDLIHDAHIAALCLEHGVTELITGDRDFSRFPFLGVVNPFT